LGSADLSVTQTVLTSPAYIANPLDLRIDVTNNGPDTAPGFVRATLPASADFVGAVPSAGQCSEESGVVTCALGSLVNGQAETVTVTMAPAEIAPDYPTTAAVSSFALDPSPADDTFTVAPSAIDIGDRVWQDLDGDGLQDPGEPGVVSALIYLLDAANLIQGITFTDTNGEFFFDLTVPDSYRLKFIPPPGFVFSPPNQGGDDRVDSDADPATGDSPLFGPLVASDPQRWDAGLVSTTPCVPPDEPLYLFDLTLSTDGNDFPILHFMDPNQPTQVTGYNVYRSSDAALPIGSWAVVADDVIDMDESIPNKQWVDTSGDIAPMGVWFYQVTAFSNLCPAEGPF
jgi:hypothetical protein